MLRNIAWSFGLCLILFTEAKAQPKDMREAARLDQQGKCKESAVFYEKALAGGSISSALLNNAGNHYLLCGSPEKARAQFERLVKIDPLHVNANLQLAILAAGSQHREKASAYLSQVKSEDPQVLFAKGNVLSELGMFEQAEQTFQRVLIQMPSDFDVLYHLGRAAARAQHYSRAQSVLTAALAVRPNSVDALLELGLAHAATSDSARAVYLLAQAKQKAPERADIALALARAAEDAHFYGDSAMAYDDYVRLKPQDVIARRDRARVLGYTDSQLAEGLREMRTYIASHPEDAVGYYNLAQFTWQKEPETSLAQLASALRADPKFVPAHVSRAWLLHRLGRSTEAAKHLEAAIGISPDNLQALDQLGLVYLALDRPADAEKVLGSAFVLDKNNPDVLTHLGRALMTLGREEEAQRFLDAYQSVRPSRKRDPRREAGMITLATLPEAERRSREIDRFRRLAQARPDDPILQRNLAELLLGSGDGKQAEIEFDRLLSLNADAQTLEEAGTALARAGRYSLARRFSEKAAVERPTSKLHLANAILALDGPSAALQAVNAIPIDARTHEFVLVKAHILEAAGQRDEAASMLTKGLHGTVVQPGLATSAAMQLLRYGRDKEALDIVGRSIQSFPDDNDLLLTRALLSSIGGSAQEAEQQLKAIQSRWPEWDRPYLAHGLLLAAGDRTGEAIQKLKIAIGLGSEEPAARCTLMKLTGEPVAGPQCACATDLRAFALGSCTN